MQSDLRVHNFHIPVMGTGYTIDTPIKVAHYGIDSVISIIDHRLIEYMRWYHAGRENIPYEPITDKEEDSRAKRVTAYLDMVHDIVLNNFKKLKLSKFTPGTELSKYFELLPNSSSLKQLYLKMHALMHEGKDTKDLQKTLKRQMHPGSIDVNIMTKLDKVNHTKDKKPLPVEYNDAHSALRGFANSKLSSSVVLSAGLNPRLYNYITNFEDFFPDNNGRLKKKIILKVSDYRSALVQGKLLAKKGLWVSEFRIESGLNCGGHAFATQGHLLGPILEEFKEKRDELISTLFDIYVNALKETDKLTLKIPPKVAISVQGGVGTSDEHNFLLENYRLDSIGWGSPFLLVPEAVNIDKSTLDLLAIADEEDLYLSHVSPLGVPFNTVKRSSAELEKQSRIASGKPGSPCVKKHLMFNTEFTEKPICLASRQYQNLKIKELQSTIHAEQTLQKEIDKVTEKMCLCSGLANPALINANIKLPSNMKGVTVCPGPNIAYFSRQLTLAEMVDHIYGRRNVIRSKNRPHVFIKELRMYMDYLKKITEEDNSGESQKRYLAVFKENLLTGIQYYKDLFYDIGDEYFEITNLENMEAIEDLDREVR